MHGKHHDCSSKFETLSGFSARGEPMVGLAFGVRSKCCGGPGHCQSYTLTPGEARQLAEFLKSSAEKAEARGSAMKDFRDGKPPEAHYRLFDSN